MTTAPSDRAVLFHVGYHKTATTWLQQVFFARHPQLEPVVDSREPWRDELVRALVRPSAGNFNPVAVRAELERRAAGLAPGTVPVVSAERLSGHPLSGHYDQPDIARRIDEAFPEARILLVLRDQVGLVESIYFQLVREGLAVEFDALLRGNWRLPGFTLAAYEFDRVVEQYWNIFGQDRVQVLWHDRLRADPQAFLADLCSFAGVADDVDSDTATQKNVSPPPAVAKILVRLNRLRRSDLNRAPLISFDRRHLEAAARLLTRFVPSGQLLSREQREMVAARFRASNERLEDLLTRRTTRTFP